MAVDMFLTLEDGAKIKGETQDSVYKDKGGIDVLAWSWGASQSGTTHMGSGGGSGKANFQDISLTKYVDKATPTLLKHLTEGTHIPSGKLIVRKAGGEKVEYITIELTDIMVTSLSTGGSGGEDRLTENLTLNFAQFKIVYKPQETDGTGGADVEFGWDIAGGATA